MKKIFSLAFSIFVVGIFGTIQVQAKNFYFVNDNNVEMSEKEYNFFTEMYWEGYQQFVSKEEYDNIRDNGFFESEIQKVENIDTYLVPFSLTHETKSKKLSIAKACSSTCLISITNNWKGVPNVKSYDIIGALFTGNINRINEPRTEVYYASGKNSSNVIKYDNNGFGASIKLPNTNEILTVNQTFQVMGNGKIYASYQHATKSITQNNSLNFRINIGGYGKVFDFYNNAYGVYDGMGGVDIDC